MNTIVSDILRFAEQSDLDGLNPTILTPLPGMRDYARYDGEGRILFKNYPEDWEKYTLAFPVTSMPNITGAGLRRRYVQVLQYFRPDHIAARYWRTYETVSAEAAWHGGPPTLQRKRKRNARRRQADPDGFGRTRIRLIYRLSWDG